MRKVEGVYIDGKVVLLEAVPDEKPVNVVVMFPDEEVAKPINPDKPFKYSWQQPDFVPFKGTLSDAVIEERRGE